MTNSKIFAIATLTGLLLVTVAAQNTFGDSIIEILPIGYSLTTGAAAVPGWVDNNFKWYGEGKIGQSDLLNSLTYMLDNNIMHLSDKAAQEVSDLRAENNKLRSMVDSSQSDESDENLMDTHDMAINDLKGDRMMQSGDEYGRVKVQFHWDEETEQESLNHLRKAYDLNPNLETKVVQFDKDHDKWIDVLSIDWGSTSSKDCSAAERSSDENSSCWIRISQTNAGDPDRPFITGQVPNPASDRPTEEVAFYYNKIAFAHDTVDDIMAKGGTTSAWKDGIDKLSSIHGDSTVDSVVDDLQGIVVLCSTAIDKEILKIQAEVDLLEELQDRQSDDSTTNQYGESDLEFIQRHAGRVDEKIQSLQNGLDVLDDKLATVGDDAQLANLDLQNTLQKQQQLLQMLSGITKSMHDTAMSTIRNIG